MGVDLGVVVLPSYLVPSQRIHHCSGTEGMAGGPEPVLHSTTTMVDF